MLRRFFRNRFGQGNNSGAGGGRGGGGGGMGQGQGRGGMGQGRGRGGGNKPGSGPGGNCVCPKCGKKVSHVAGQRCMDLTCPDCGIRLVRE